MTKGELTGEFGRTHGVHSLSDIPSSFSLVLFLDGLWHAGGATIPYHVYNSGCHKRYFLRNQINVYSTSPYSLYYSAKVSYDRYTDFFNNVRAGEVFAYHLVSELTTLTDGAFGWCERGDRVCFSHASR